MAWMAVAGHDNVGTLAAMVMEPAATRGQEYPDPQWASNGDLTEQGERFIELVWNSLYPSEWTALLAQFGLSDTTINADCTVQIKAWGNSYANYNARAHLTNRGGWPPSMPNRYEDTRIRLTDLEVIT